MNVATAFHPATVLAYYLDRIPFRERVKGLLKTFNSCSVEVISVLNTDQQNRQDVA